MTRALSFVRLDFITVKPYLTLKNLLLFAAVAFIMSFSGGMGAGAIGILMIYAAMYVTYPFAVCEQNGMDALYATLSIRRGTVVTGRYLFALAVDLSVGILAYALSFFISLALKTGFNASETLLITCVLFLVYSIIQAIQLPIFFRLGYTKAKLLAYLPFAGMPLAMLLFSNLLKDVVSAETAARFAEWFVNNPFLTALICAIMWFGIIAASYKASLRHYKKRDF